MNDNIDLKYDSLLANTNIINSRPDENSLWSALDSFSDSAQEIIVKNTDYYKSFYLTQKLPSYILTDPGRRDFYQFLQSAPKEWIFSCSEIFELIVATKIPSVDLLIHATKNDSNPHNSKNNSGDSFNFHRIFAQLCGDDKDYFMSLIRDFNRMDKTTLLFHEDVLMEICENNRFKDSRYDDFRNSYVANFINRDRLSFARDFAIDGDVADYIIENTFLNNYVRNADLELFLEVYFPERADYENRDSAKSLYLELFYELMPPKILSA